MKAWTAVEDAALKEMVAGDMTARAISQKMGRTVNSVVGRCLRLSLRLGANRPSEKMRRNRTPKKQETLPKPSAPPRLKPTTFECRAVRMVDLKDRGECKWPINDVPLIGDSLILDGEYLFCGLPASPGENYCTEHQRWSVGTGTASERSALRGTKNLT